MTQGAGGSAGDTPPRSGSPFRGVRLAVDVGAARVGLAASDPDGILATPVATLPRDRSKRTDLRAVATQAVEREAVVVYVGHPLNLQGQDTASTQDAVRYAQRLARELDRRGSTAEVRLLDERLSTVTAHRQLRAAGLDHRSHRAVVDQAAAVEILQHGLDVEQSHHGGAGRLVSAPAPRTEGSTA